MDTIKYFPLLPLGSNSSALLLPGFGQNETVGHDVVYLLLNRTGSDDFARQQIPVITLVIISVYILFGLLIGFLNAITIVAIARSPELRNVTNMFVLSLTCSDLLLSPTLIFINFLPTIARLVGVLWARVIYSLFLSLMFTSSGTSLLSILAIAVDRYLAVLHPYRYRQLMSPARATVAIIAIWAYVTVLIFSLVAYYISMAPPQLFINISLLSVILPPAVYLGAVVSQIVVCIIASIALYVCIFFALRKIRAKSALLRSRSGASAQQQQQEHASRESRRTTTTMALVLGALILSWLPYAMVSILTTVDVLIEHNWFLYVSIFAILLLYANSFMNPIIYAARSAAYRQAYWQVLCCCACLTGSQNGQTGSEPAESKSRVIAKRRAIEDEKNGNVIPVDV